MKEIEKLLKKKNQPKSSKKSVDEWDLLEFKRRLNQDPPQVILKKNPQYNNHYIPLHNVEIMLDILFATKEFVMSHKPDFVEGNTVFYMDVVVTHPVTLERLTYSGTSVVPIMPNTDNQREVHKRIPAGESFAILNACQKIGRVFRADNETFVSALDNYFTKKQDSEKESPEFDRLKRMINSLNADGQVVEFREGITKYKERNLITESEYNELIVMCAVKYEELKN